MRLFIRRSFLHALLPAWLLSERCQIKEISPPESRATAELATRLLRVLINERLEMTQSMASISAQSPTLPVNAIVFVLTLLIRSDPHVSY